MFAAGNPDLPVAQVIKGEPCSFGSAETVPVGQIEQEHVSDAVLRDRSEEAFNLVLRKVFDRLLVTVPTSRITSWFHTNVDSDVFP